MQNALRRRVAWWVVPLLSAAGARTQADIEYDFRTNAGVDRFAYRNSIPSSPVPPTSPLIPSNEFTPDQYPFLAASDNSRHSTVLIGGSSRAATRFVFHVVEDPSTIRNLNVLWEGSVGGISGGTVEIWLWNARTAGYRFVAGTSSTVDVVISVGFSTDAGDYVDALNGNSVTILAINTADNASVTTDLVLIGLRQCNEDADCNDDDPCTDDVCTTAWVCEYTGNLEPCTDGDPCTLDDACSEGECRGGPPPDCSTTGDPCTAASCDPSGNEGNCDTLTPRVDGSACDDGDACTSNEQCEAGLCRGELAFSLADWSRYFQCFGGVGVGIEPDCDCVDFDRDHDADLTDLAEFLRKFGTG